LEGKLEKIDWLFEKKNSSIIIAALVILAVAIAWLAPAEQTLGDKVKLVYVHVGIIWTGLFMYVVSAVLSLYFLVTDRKKVFKWSFASEATALRFWGLHAVMGAVSSKLIWGEIAWAEPRMKITLIILVSSIIAYSISGLIKNTDVTSILNVGMPLLILLLILRAGRIMHPINPVSGSTYLSIQISVGTITLLFVLVAFLITGMTLKNFRALELVEEIELGEKQQKRSEN
jgi:hypothetical protein